MNIDKATPELYAALSTAQGEIENATKSSTNPHFKSKYADLAEVLTTIRETFPKHGLSLTQAPSFDGSLAHVTTLVAHSGGGSIMSIASCSPAKTDAQGIGAATTYLRRYSASAMAGIAQEDDDGNSAAHDRKPEPVGQPNSDAWEQAALIGWDRKKIEAIGRIALEWWEAEDVPGAADYLDQQAMPHEAKIAVATMFDSKFRSALKRHHKEKAA